MAKYYEIQAIPQKLQLIAIPYREEAIPSLWCSSTGRRKKKCECPHLFLFQNYAPCAARMRGQTFARCNANRRSAPNLHQSSAPACAPPSVLHKPNSEQFYIGIDLATAQADDNRKSARQRSRRLRGRQEPFICAVTCRNGAACTLKVHFSKSTCLSRPGALRNFYPYSRWGCAGRFRPAAQPEQIPQHQPARQNLEHTQHCRFPPGSRRARALLQKTGRSQTTLRSMPYRELPLHGYA